MALGTVAFAASNGWATAVTAGGPASQDAATITATSSIDGTKKRRMALPRGAEHVAVRLSYDTATTAITTQCAIKVFGRTCLDGGSTFSEWEVLPNRNGDIQATLTAAPSSDLDDSLSHTVVDEFDHVFCVRNCTEIVIGVEAAFAPTDGSSATPIIEVKTVEAE